MHILELSPGRPDLIDQAATLLHAAFLGRTDDWQDLESSRSEVTDSLASDRISRVALDATGDVVGWIAAIPSYGGRVWEIHPLVVSASHRRCGIGRALVEAVRGLRFAARGSRFEDSRIRGFEDSRIRG